MKPDHSEVNTNDNDDEEEEEIPPVEQSTVKRKRVHFSSSYTDVKQPDTTTTPMNTNVDEMLRDLTNLSENILADSDEY